MMDEAMEDELYEQASIGRRLSICPQCRQLATSDPSLPFFRSRPMSKYDSHYDGCRGWD